MIKANKVDRGSRKVCNSCSKGARYGLSEYIIQTDEGSGGFGFCLCNKCAKALIVKLYKQIDEEQN